MISSKMLESLSEQFNKEIYSGYFYLSMASYASSIGLEGVANWFNMQMQEELLHAKKFYGYINSGSRRVILKAIDDPPADFSSAKDLFEKTLAHERKVTKLIGTLVNLAREEKDEVTEKFLQWFVKEQIEEEATPLRILQQFNLAGEDKEALLKIDSELSKRVPLSVSLSDSIG